MKYEKILRLINEHRAELEEFGVKSLEVLGNFSYLFSR